MDRPQSPTLRTAVHSGFPVVFRQVRIISLLALASHQLRCKAGDSAILVEFGKMSLDLTVRAHIQAFLLAIGAAKIPGVSKLCPCIRSILVGLWAVVISKMELTLSSSVTLIQM